MKKKSRDTIFATVKKGASLSDTMTIEYHKLVQEEGNRKRYIEEGAIEMRDAIIRYLKKTVEENSYIDTDYKLIQCDVCNCLIKDIESGKYLG